MTFRRTLAAALAAGAIAAPAASAQPADTHASAVTVAAAAQQRQDLRSPDAVDAARAQRQDLRSADAVDAALRATKSSSAVITVAGPCRRAGAHDAAPAAETEKALAEGDGGTDWVDARARQRRPGALPRRRRRAGDPHPPRAAHARQRLTGAPPPASAPGTDEWRPPSLAASSPPPRARVRPLRSSHANQGGWEETPG